MAMSRFDAAQPNLPPMTYSVEPQRPGGAAFSFIRGSNNLREDGRRSMMMGDSFKNQAVYGLPGDFARPANNARSSSHQRFPCSNMVCDCWAFWEVSSLNPRTQVCL